MTCEPTAAFQGLQELTCPEPPRASDFSKFHGSRRPADHGLAIPQLNHRPARPLEGLVSRWRFIQGMARGRHLGETADTEPEAAHSKTSAGLRGANRWLLEACHRQNRRPLLW